MAKSTTTYILSEEVVRAPVEMDDVGDNVCFEETLAEAEAAIPFDYAGDAILYVLDFLKQNGITVPRFTRNPLFTPIAVRCGPTICVSPQAAEPCLAALSAFEPTVAEMKTFYAKSVAAGVMDADREMSAGITFIKAALTSQLHMRAWLIIVVYTNHSRDAGSELTQPQNISLAERLAPPFVDRRIDEFLARELERIRQLSSNAPDEDGQCIELYWALVVGVAKTKLLPVTAAMKLVQDYLMTVQSDVQVPAKITADQARLDRVQAEMMDYRVDPQFATDYSSVTPEQLAKARNGMLLVSSIGAGLLALNHYRAMNGDSFYGFAVLFIPMVTTVVLLV